MELRDLTPQQLDRIYDRLYAQLPDGGCFGWDWRTLDMVYPSLGFALWAVHCAIVKQIKKGANQ